jgi:hypothetical protein
VFLSGIIEVMIRDRMYDLNEVPVDLTVHEIIDSMNTICVQNISDSGNAYIGGTSVSYSSYGHKLFPGSSITMELSASSRIYAVGDEGVSRAILEIDIT